MPRDPYDVLAVSRTATEEEIKKSYRKLAREFHPDRNPGDKAAETKFKEVQEAFAILSDKNKKQQSTILKNIEHSDNKFLLRKQR